MGFFTADKPSDGLPPNAPRGREAERLLAAEMLQELRQIRIHSTQAAARLAGMAINDVLDVQTRAFGPSGLIALEYNVAAGSIAVDVHGTNDVTVDAAGAAGSAPAVGTGVYLVPAGDYRTVPVASHQVTLYGTAGDVISFVVFSAGPRPVV